MGGLSPSESKYPAHKLELLALKWSVVDKFYSYSDGNLFTVVTDNNPLIYVLTSAKLDAASHRWLAALFTFDFSIKYIARKANQDADGCHDDLISSFQTTPLLKRQSGSKSLSHGFRHHSHLISAWIHIQLEQCITSSFVMNQTASHPPSHWLSLW